MKKSQFHVFVRFDFDFDLDFVFDFGFDFDFGSFRCHIITLSHVTRHALSVCQFVSLPACQLSHTNAQTPNQTATMFRTYTLYKYNHVRVCIRCCVFVCLLGELSQGEVVGWLVGWLVGWFVILFRHFVSSNRQQFVSSVRPSFRQFVRKFSSSDSFVSFRCVWFRIVWFGFVSFGFVLFGFVSFRFSFSFGFRFSFSFCFGFGFGFSFVQVHQLANEIK